MGTLLESGFRRPQTKASGWSGGTGRRTRLKIWRPKKAWGFDSPLHHHLSIFVFNELQPSFQPCDSPVTREPGQRRLRGGIRRSPRQTDGGLARGEAQQPDAHPCAVSSLPRSDSPPCPENPRPKGKLEHFSDRCRGPTGQVAPASRWLTGPPGWRRYQAGYTRNGLYTIRRNALSFNSNRLHSNSVEPGQSKASTSP